MSSHREICAICGQVSRVGFLATDQAWQHAVHHYYQNSLVCLQCFTLRGDEHLIEWDKDIQLFPMSLARHIREARPDQVADIAKGRPLM